MFLELLPFYLLLGMLAGLLGGALGLGGGIVVVPGLLLIFHWFGMDGDYAMQIAVATSLATILVTSTSAVRAHHRRGALRWPLVFRLAPGIVVGAVVGVLIADWLPGQRLTQLFGVFSIIMAVQMMLNSRGKDVPAGPERLPPPAAQFGVGSLIGMASALFGIGGGAMTVPFLNACRVRMQEAVAVSSACGFPIALAGCLAFVVVGWGQDLPPGSLGYVNLTAAVCLGVASYPMAKVGAALAHRLPARTLKRLFAVVLILIGLKLALG